MSEKTNRRPGHNPQDLERLLVSRQNAGDVEAMAALYEPQAVLDCGGGKLLQGQEAIRRYFGEVVATAHKYQMGEQRAALVSGDLALTSTRSSDGTVTAEVARRQSGGTWLWVIDQFEIV